MNHSVQTFSSDHPFEIIVGYDWEREQSYEAEPGNPATRVYGTTHTEFTSVEIVVSGRGIDILPQLTDKEKESILSQLNYEI